MSSATVDPVRRSVVVPCDPAKAFTLFTDEIGQWWPTATHSVGLADTTAVTVEPRVGGEVREHLRSGATSTWGTVTAWDPPAELAMTWHPGYGADQATDLRVRFTSHEGGTLVELEHAGWERLADGVAKRANYDGGWVGVIGCYAVHAGAESSAVS